MLIGFLNGYILVLKNGLPFFYCESVAFLFILRGLLTIALFYSIALSHIVGVLINTLKEIGWQLFFGERIGQGVFYLGLTDREFW